MKQIIGSASSLALVAGPSSGTKKSSARAHSWVTVIDPRNHRSLLQACDDCGVVKSENSVIRNCGAASGQALLSDSLSVATRIAI